LLNITNDVVEEVDLENPIKIRLSRDLNYTQEIDIYIEPEFSHITNEFQIDIAYATNTGNFNGELIRVDLPADLLDYDSVDPFLSTKAQNNYINSEIFEFSNSIDSETISGKTLVILDKSNNFFVEGDVVYIDNFFLFVSGDTEQSDFSGAYKIESVGTIGSNAYYQIDTDTTDFTIIGSIIKISNYNGMKLNIMRVEEDLSTSLTDRYKITKELL
jgi:hypothetical protein